MVRAIHNVIVTKGGEHQRTNRFNDFSRPEGQELRAMSRCGELIFHMADSPEDANQVHRPEIDRADLNHILFESLANSTIHWNHKLLSVQHVGEEYELQFANGETVKADLVVGADGAWTRVRPLVTSEKPKYSGVTFLSWSIEDFDKRFPELADLVGRGSLFCFGQGKMLTTREHHPTQRLRCTASLSGLRDGGRLGQYVAYRAVFQ